MKLLKVHLYFVLMKEVFFHFREETFFTNTNLGFLILNIAKLTCGSGKVARSKEFVRNII